MTCVRERGDTFPFFLEGCVVLILEGQSGLPIDSPQIQGGMYLFLLWVDFTCGPREEISKVAVNVEHHG